MNKYMKKKKVPKTVQVKIKKYLEYSLNEESAGNLGENAVFNMLSETLRAELVSHVQGKVIQKTMMFSLIYEKEFLVQVTTIMDEKVFSPDDQVCKENAEDYSVFIIGTGKVELYIHQSHSTLTYIVVKAFVPMIIF
jgi:hypothetical protein